MTSSTFENAVLTPRTRGKGSGSPFKLLNFLTVLFLSLLLQVGAAVAQPNTDTPPLCYGCTSEDIKAIGITVDPPIDAKCTDALVVPGVKITIKLDVTSKTRYGFYIMYSLQQKLADGTIVPVAGGTNVRECHPVILPQGPYNLELGFNPDLIAGATLQIVNVLTAWGNQIQELEFCGGDLQGNGTYDPSIINEAGVTCSVLDPKCKLYPAISFEAKITSKPSAAFSTPQAVCAGTQPTITIIGTPGAIVEYKIGTTVQTPVILNAQGNYVVNVPANLVTQPNTTVTITKVINPDDATCFDATQKVANIPVNPPATVDAGPFQIVCSSSTITLAGSWTIAPGATWTGGAGQFSNNRAGNSTYTPTAGEIGTMVTLTLTTDDPSGPCPAVADQVTITINRAASVEAGANVPVCSDGFVNLTATNLGGATSVTYSAPNPGGIIETLSATTAKFTPNINAGTVTITATTNDPDAGGPCLAATDQLVVTVNPRATLTVGGPYEVCANGSVMISVSGLGGANMVTFAPNASGSFSNTSATSTTFTPSIASGNVTITVTTNDPDGAGPCSSVVGYISIKVFPVASLTVTGDRAVCAGGSTVLTATNLGSATSATFSLPNGGGSLTNITPTSATFTPSIASGTVTVTVETNNPDGPCNGVSQNIAITVNGVATATAGTYAPICAGSNIMLMGTYGGAATSATWARIGAGLAGSLTPTASGPNQANATYVPSAADILAGNVTFRLTTNEPEGPCVAVSSLATVTINAAAYINITASKSVCATGTVAFNATGSGFSSVTWSSFGGTFNPANNVNTVFTPTMASGTYSVTIVTNDPDGAGPCSAATATSTVRIDGIATVEAGPAQTVCQGQPVQLAGNWGGTATSGTWSGGSGEYANNNNTSKTSIYYPSPAEQTAGSVVLTLTTNDPTGECGPVSDMVTITINRAATVSITTRPVTTCAGVPVSLTATTNSAPVTWSVPNNAGSFSPNPGLTTSFTPNTTGVLVITASSADPDGVGPTGPCPVATSTVTVTVNTCDPGYCTYTQGYFGQDVGNGKASYKSGNDCVQSRVEQTIQFALTKWTTMGGMQVANMNFKYPSTVAGQPMNYDISKIREYLPGGGPSAPYLGTIAGLTSTSPKNTLLAQTITLGLNLGLNSTLGAFTLKNEWLRTGSSSDCGANPNGLSTQCFKFDISANMNVDGTPGVQINDIWILANRALLQGQQGVPALPQGVSLSMIAGAADAVNNAFDECRVPLGWSENNPCVTSSTVAPTIGGVANMGAADRSTGSLKVNAYPNPFKDRVFIKFTSPVSGKAVVEIYDMTGRRLEVMNKGTVVAGRENVVEYNVPVANRNSIIYRVTVDKFSVNGRLISPTK